MTAILWDAPRTPLTVVWDEQIVLGALIASGVDALGSFAQLDVEHFADPINGLIFGTIRRRAGNGQPFDTIALRDEFAPTGALNEVGGTRYLHQLVAGDIAASKIHVQNVRDAWLRRHLIDVSQRLGVLAGEVVDGAFDPGSTPPTEQASYLIARLRGLLAVMEGGLA